MALDLVLQISVQRVRRKWQTQVYLTQLCYDLFWFGSLTHSVAPLLKPELNQLMGHFPGSTPALADEIIKAQRREIKEMDWLINDIKQNGPATTEADASVRAVPDFQGKLTGSE